MSIAMKLIALVQETMSYSRHFTELVYVAFTEGEISKIM